MEYGPAPESATLANEWLDAHARKFGLFINGDWVDGRGFFETFNPATTKPLAQIAQAGSEEINLAVAAARRAQPGWQALGGHERAKHLYALARQVQKHSR